MTKHAIIYVPGLGDSSIKGRQKLLWFWRYPSIQIEIKSKRWTIDEHWHIKLDRLLKRIDTLYAEGKIVSLIGESAGASAVLQALVEREEKLNAVVLLCGKSQYPERVSPYLYRKNPALQTSISRSHNYAQNLSRTQKAKLLNLHPIADPVVPVWETKIPGVKNARIPFVGHASSIIFGMTAWNFRIVRFVKNRALAN